MRHKTNIHYLALSIWSLINTSLCTWVVNILAQNGCFPSDIQIRIISICKENGLHLFYFINGKDIKTDTECCFTAETQTQQNHKHMCSKFCGASCLLLKIQSCQNIFHTVCDPVACPHTPGAHPHTTHNLQTFRHICTFTDTLHTCQQWSTSNMDVHMHNHNIHAKHAQTQAKATKNPHSQKLKHTQIHTSAHVNTHACTYTHPKFK